MTIDGEGAGKGDVYRPVDRDIYNENFENIKFKTVKPQRWELKNGKYRRVYPYKSKSSPNPAYQNERSK